MFISMDSLVMRILVTACRCHGYHPRLCIINLFGLVENWHPPASTPLSHRSFTYYLLPFTYYNLRLRLRSAIGLLPITSYNLRLRLRHRSFTYYLLQPPASTQASAGYVIFTSYVLHHTSFSLSSLLHPSDNKKCLVNYEILKPCRKISTT
jgi:hypothetical protein